jgi:transcriptional regulator with XRE-family HTH domain
MSLFSKNLRFLRKKGNHNQDEIALLFRKRANTIGNWENQKSEPSLKELMKLGEFFKVSVGDLLHTDMETLSGPADKMSGISAISAKTAGTSAVPQQPAQAVASGEGSPDAFWMILRELRVIGEKLDGLVSGMEPGGFKKNSDKSYH